MTRVARSMTLGWSLHLALLIGPMEGDGLSDEDLELGWHYHGQQVMDESPRPPGIRPWGFWHFDVGEEMPRDRDAATLRLAELGELTDNEFAALGEQAAEARLRVGTAGEYISGSGTTARWVDREAVELHEAISRARSER